MNPTPPITVNARGGARSGCGSVLFALFSLPFLVFGAVFFVMTFRPLLDHGLSYLWSKAPCLIATSGVDQLRDGDGHQRYVFRVRYQYETNGATYTGTTYRLGYDGSSDYAEALRLSHAYQFGARSECRIDPKDGHRAVLRPGPLAMTAVIFLPLLFVAAGGTGLVIAARGIAKRNQAPAAALTSAAAKKTGARAAAYVALGIMTAAGAGLFAGVFAAPLSRYFSAGKWTAVPCRILSSEVERHAGDDSDTYAVHILYEYEHNGEPYRSSRYGFFGGSSSGEASKRQTVDRYPAGSDATCYVDPDDPYTAVLDRSFQPILAVALIPLLLALIGAGALAVMVRTALRRGQQDGGVYARGGSGPLPAGELFVPGGGRDAIELKPTTGPAGKFLGMLLFAGIWNGITGVVAVLLIGAIREGEASWLPALFLVPFVLAGLGLAVAAVKALLALFNPRIRLRLTPGELALGQPSRLQWDFTGDSSRVAKLQITLTGKEVARYRRGTNTVTDESHFAAVLLVDCDDRRMLPRGEAVIEVPAGSMHSLSAPSNKIIWMIKVRGDVPNWPDLDMDFEINVLPQPVPWRMT